VTPNRPRRDERPDFPEEDPDGGPPTYIPTEEISMIYESAPCDLCQQWVDRAADATAFDLRHDKPRAIDLAGEQPWIGVRIICPACLEFFHAAAIARQTRKG
jgi:hypothetical protein